EYDQEEPEAVFENDGSYLFEARIPLDDVQNMLDIPLPLEEADSLSGFIYNQLGHVPTVGERLIFGDATFEVTEITGRRIRKVRATRIAANAE
ncbi:MAG: transporter associated domain-containing protein, partial [Anaerolineae bacterium]|nr:transporter associated domain-containing protein [Anaerolineae bacterium]